MGLYLAALCGLWNVIFMPLQVCFNIKFEGVILAMEVVTILVYLGRCGFYCWEYSKEPPGRAKVIKGLIAAHLALIAFPFAWVFTAFPDTEQVIVVIFSLIRVFHPRPFFLIFTKLTKQYLNWQNWLRII
jgi:hypothetical protein